MTDYNIAALLNRGSEKFKNRGYIYEKHNGKYVEKTFSDFTCDVLSFATFLNNKGLTKKNIALYGPNSYNYMVADIAIMGYVGVCVSISKEWKTYDIENVFKKTDIKAMVYDETKEKEVCELKKIFPYILYISLGEVSKKYKSDTKVSPVKSDECSKIIFSSGTTGMPKAIMLSQKNMFANWENLYKRAKLGMNDVCYLFLPLSHAYGGICVFLYSLITGMQIYLSSDAKKIFEELREVKPTVFCAVPLIYEKLYSLCMNSEVKPEDFLEGNRFLFSGGAFLKLEIRQYLKNRGINLLHSYGLSETSSIVAVEYSNTTDFDSVGTIFENMDVKTDALNGKDEGEILVRGENVFMGYYNIAIKDTFDCDGYFHTGDIGYIKGEKLYICGRKKRTILFSNGENIYPDEIEALFLTYEGITKAKVYEKDGKIFAQIYVNNDTDVKAIVADVNLKLPKYSVVTDYEIICDSMDIRIK